MGSGGESNHHPVLLHILNRRIQLKSPFKFNPHWLKNEDLVKFLKDSWVVYSDNIHESPASHFASNLKKIKEVSVAWSVN